MSSPQIVGRVQGENGDYIVKKSVRSLPPVEVQIVNISCFADHRVSVSST